MSANEEHIDLLYELVDELETVQRALIENQLRTLIGAYARKALIRKRLKALTGVAGLSGVVSA